MPRCRLAAALTVDIRAHAASPSATTPQLPPRTDELPPLAHADGPQPPPRTDELPLPAHADEPQPSVRTDEAQWVIPTSPCDSVDGTELASLERTAHPRIRTPRTQRTHPYALAHVDTHTYANIFPPIWHRYISLLAPHGSSCMRHATCRKVVPAQTHVSTAVYTHVSAHPCAYVCAYCP